MIRCLGDGDVTVLIEGERDGKCLCGCWVLDETNGETSLESTVDSIKKLLGKV